MNGIAYGQRKLRNQCLTLLMKANEAETLPLALQQFEQAKTMTDQIASFALLINCSDASVRLDVIDKFYQQWSTDDLVLDKWFAMQAFSDLPGALDRVKALLNHSAFSLKNPNKVRAVIGAFCIGNYRNFHAADGSGYAFLSSMLLTLDQINPQITARLATPFTRWQRFDKPRQKAMQTELKRLSKANLSVDLNEIVTKSMIVK